ncbi:YdhT family protein [Serratia sp. D1N4]
MSTVNSPIEGTTMIAGTLYGGVAFSQNGQNIVGKSSPINIVHCGDNAMVYDDVVSTNDDVNFPNMGGKIATTGENSCITGGNASLTSALGFGSSIMLEYFFPDAENLTLTDAIAVTANTNGTIRTAGYVADSVLMAAGDASQIIDCGNNNILFSCGTDNNINSDGGRGTTIFAAKNPRYFTLNEQGVAAIAWHDGIRARVTVVYEGENGIEKGRMYRLDENGNIVAI